MIRYMVGRLCTALPVLFGVSVVIFTMQKLLPGDAAVAILGPQATAEELTALRAELGLDQPLHVQYWRWFSKVLRGDFGRSIQLRVRITELIFPKFKNTMILAAGALSIAVTVGLVVGVLSGTHANSLFDRLGMVCTIVGASMPGFWVGLVLMYFFALKFRLLPSTGMYDLRGDGGLLDLLRHLILPAITSSVVATAIISRLVRSTFLEIMQHDYIKTARAKGLRERTVIYAHALKNALPTFINIVALQMGYLLGGSLFSEVIFSWPGIGFQLYSSIAARDVPVVQACVLLTATVFTLANLASDVLQGVVNPRIRVAGR
jgi:peptide/nickel transport system permease protein